MSSGKNWVSWSNNCERVLCFHPRSVPPTFELPSPSSEMHRVWMMSVSSLGWKRVAASAWKSWTWFGSVWSTALYSLVWRYVSASREFSRANSVNLWDTVEQVQKNTTRRASVNMHTSNRTFSLQNVAMSQKYYPNQGNIECMSIIRYIILFLHLPEYNLIYVYIC